MTYMVPKSSGNRLWLFIHLTCISRLHFTLVKMRTLVSSHFPTTAFWPSRKCPGFKCFACIFWSSAESTGIFNVGGRFLEEAAVSGSDLLLAVRRRRGPWSWSGDSGSFARFENERLWTRTPQHAAIDCTPTQIKSNQIYLPAQVQETMHNVKPIITKT